MSNDFVYQEGELLPSGSPIENDFVYIDNELISDIEVGEVTFIEGRGIGVSWSFLDDDMNATFDQSDDYTASISHDGGNPDDRNHFPTAWRGGTFDLPITVEYQNCTYTANNPQNDFEVGISTADDPRFFGTREGEYSVFYSWLEGSDSNPNRDEARFVYRADNETIEDIRFERENFWDTENDIEIDVTASDASLYLNGEFVTSLSHNIPDAFRVAHSIESDGSNSESETSTIGDMRIT